jgi:hypothetical protein
MSDMVENGSSGGGPSLPPGEPHDEFLELCALATTDWLSAQERRRLDEHLAQCPTCREVMRQYDALVGSGIPAEALHTAPAKGAGLDSGRSLDEAEASLLARLDRETPIPAPPESTGPHVAGRMPGSPALPPFPADSLWHHMWWQSAAGLLLAAALVYSVYRSGMHRGAEMAAVAAPPAARRADAAPTTKVEAATAERESAALRQQISQLAALRAQIARQSAQIVQLGAEKAEIERNLDSEETAHRSLEQARDELARQLQTAQSQFEEVSQRQEAVAAQNAADTVKVIALNRQIDDLSAGLQRKDQELAREQQLLDHDQDIRDLIGSRNLYIAEVYDVDKAGNTRQPFGRVFYTKGKSLVFYAYDLDQQPGVRDAASFQAWGRRGPDQDRAVNLGILYADNAAKKRWVLRTDNPKTLADIDAVFVTVEPPGGSSHPSGKPLLFAYLRIEANHP